jgi:hypothetical protein
MRRHWLTLVGLALGLCGCWNTNHQNIKPPTPPPEYNLPPDGDDRFIKPPSFPTSTMTTGQPRKPETNTTPGPMGPGTGGMPSSRFGAGGMGGR